MGTMWIKSDVDIVRCTAFVWEPLPQEKAVVRSYCFSLAYFRESAAEPGKGLWCTSVFNFYITEFLFVERKILVS